MALIQAGANVAALNSLKETALHSACRSGSVECAQLMIDQGLDVNAPNVNFETPIHLMAHDSEKMVTIMEHSKWKRMPRSASQEDDSKRPRRSRSLEEAKRGGDHIHATRRQSEIRMRSECVHAPRTQYDNEIRGRPKARGIFVLCC